jgi:hypothetical protein
MGCSVSVFEIGRRIEANREGVCAAQNEACSNLFLPARANLRDDFIRAETRAGSQRHYLFPAGTFCFKSAVQFSTTLICPGDCSAALTIRNRWPSGDTS